MAHWLMKSEPGSYSWEQLVRDKATEWDGVRNPTARINLKAIKGEPGLAKMELVRLSRLSVSPVRDEEWKAILKMAGS